jgi:hypothetical protein
MDDNNFQFYCCVDRFRPLWTIVREYICNGFTRINKVYSNLFNTYLYFIM